MLLKKVKKIAIREVQYFFFTLFLLGVGTLPFLTGHFTIIPQHHEQIHIEEDHESDIVVLNDDVILTNQLTQKQSGLLRMKWDKSEKKESNRPIINDYFIYSIYLFLVLFIIYPVRYFIYILNILLE